MALSFPINRAPVLTLWAAVVAERLGHERETALTLGKALAGLNAQSKGRRLGILKPAGPEVAKRRASERAAAGSSTIELLGRQVPVVKTPAGVRAANAGKPESAQAVEQYLERAFGEHLAAARAAMVVLAKSLPKGELAERGFALYEAFRPSVPEGTRGWGAKGTLDLGLLAKLAKQG